VISLWIWYLSILLFGYLIGCLHGSLVAQVITGTNLKKTGVNNAGASNALIVLGKKYGALVAAIDIGKGILVILLLKMIASSFDISAVDFHTLLFVAALVVFSGHLFPFYMGFNGGKGTATTIGILLALHWQFGLIALGIFIIVALLTDFIVFGVLTLYISLLAFSIWIFPGLWPTLIAIIIFGIAAIKHIENFRRMKIGDEKRISFLFKKKA
jgi:glycerol-3-phosphate acyltransferase PlsY